MTSQTDGLLAKRGEIALARLRYVEAATHFAKAASVFPAGSARTSAAGENIGRISWGIHSLFEIIRRSLIPCI
jgi:hypothetical protein